MPQRILIADDNPTFRRTLHHFLEGVDRWEIVEAADGQEALARSLETRPDVILLDLAMPVKDGLAAAREISQLLPDIPILMCTMHQSAQLQIEAQKCGIRQVLSKTDSDLILAAIRQWIAPREARIHNAEPVPVPLVLSDPAAEALISHPTATEPATDTIDSPKSPSAPSA